MHSIVFLQLLLNFRRVARITTQLLSLLANGGGDKFRREGSGFIEIEILNFTLWLLFDLLFTRRLKDGVSVVVFH